MGGENAEAFLDQIITWLELGFQFCHNRPDYPKYESLPNLGHTGPWTTPQRSQAVLYTMQEFEEARTHDPVWNAAQN